MRRMRGMIVTVDDGHTGCRFVLTAMMTLVLMHLYFVLSPVPLQSGSSPTTESFCNFGMGKDEASQRCQVPILDGCIVAHFPGTTEPWSNISKGGATTCQFSKKDTDWKTKITGTCGKCKSQQCSARFSVMFDCAVTTPPSAHHGSKPAP